MWRDVRSALVRLRRRPGFALTVLVTLAFGIGANSAVFTVVNAVLLRELPFEDSERLVALELTRTLDGHREKWRYSYPNLLDLSRTNEALEAVVTFSDTWSFNMRVGGEAYHVWVEMVSADYFEFLGVEPFLGRAFVPEENQLPGGLPVAVISHSLWKTLYEGQRSLEERPIRLVDDVFTVVGVAPPGFHGLGDKADVWVPVTTARRLVNPNAVEARRGAWLRAAGRLREGVTLGEAREAVAAASSRLEEIHPEVNRGQATRLVPLREAWFGHLRLALFSLLGGAGVVLVIVCTNVSNLLLARTIERSRELAVRTALGAGRLRLIRQLLAESVTLALAGGLLGILFAHATTDLLISSSAVDLPRFIDTSIDLGVLGFMAALSILCGVGFGLVPALTSSRLQVAAALKEGGQTAAGRSRWRLRSVLIVGQIVLAFALLAVAAHALRSFQELRARHLGFRSDRLVTLRLNLSGEKYSDRLSKIRAAQLVLGSLAPYPEARSVAVVGPNLPLDELTGYSYSVENRPDPVLLQYHHVSLDYFDMLGMPLVEGRTFQASDSVDTQFVAVVSTQAARRFWPEDTSVLGKRIRPGRDVDDTSIPWYTVVGVVGEANQAGFRKDVDDYPDIYFHVLQNMPLGTSRLNVLVETETTSDADLLARLRAEIRKAVPDLPAYDVLTVEQRLSEQLKNDRFLVLVMGLLTSLALVLAVVGVYGLLAYLVAQGNRDLGIRLALGASRPEIFRRVVVRAAVLGAAGVGIGLAVTLALRAFLASRVYQLVGTDPGVLAAVSALLFVTVLGAGLVPAFRATRIDPNTVLREE